jgi:hypothetical protein
VGICPNFEFTQEFKVTPHNRSIAFSEKFLWAERRLNCNTAAYRVELIPITAPYWRTFFTVG